MARIRHQESLAAAATKAHASFLEELSQKYCGRFRDVVNKLAVVDCLCSLALVASQEGYVKATICEGDDLEISDGRHPMIEAMRDDPFVPNGILFTSMHRSKIITGIYIFPFRLDKRAHTDLPQGPNMGGTVNNVSVNLDVTYL